MSDHKDWPPVVGEHFTQAWINLKELPGGMMQSYSPERGHFRFGPIPAFTSCAITTNPDDAAEWRAKGEPVLVIYTADGVAPSQAPSMAEVIAAALEALEDNDNHAATVILKTAQRNAGVSPSSQQVFPRETPMDGRERE